MTDLQERIEDEEGPEVVYLDVPIFDFLEAPIVGKDYEEGACDLYVQELLEQLRELASDDEELDEQSYSEMLENTLLYLNRQRHLFVAMAHANLLTYALPYKEYEGTIYRQDIVRKAFIYITTGRTHDKGRNTLKAWNDNDIDSLIQFTYMMPGEYKERAHAFLETVLGNTRENEFGAERVP